MPLTHNSVPLQSFTASTSPPFPLLFSLTVAYCKEMEELIKKKKIGDDFLDVLECSSPAATLAPGWWAQVTHTPSATGTPLGMGDFSGTL